MKGYRFKVMVIKGIIRFLIISWYDFWYRGGIENSLGVR